MLDDESILEEGRFLSHYYYNSSTYRNGKRRDYGLKSSSYYKLKSTIQVFNNGQSQPTESVITTNPVTNPAFTSAGALTKTGNETMFKLGQQMKSYADNTSWVDFATLNSSEVYTYAQDTPARKGSLSSFLEGAFTNIGDANTATSPAADIATVDPNAKVPTSADDLLIGGGDGSCARIAAIDAAIVADSDTVALNNRITKFLEDNKYFE